MKRLFLVLFPLLMACQENGGDNPFEAGSPIVEKSPAPVPIEKQLGTEDTEAQMAVLKTDILATAQPEPCNDASQCAALPFGAKPCGGPWEYLVYSTAGTDTAQLTALVDEYNTLNRTFNEEQGLMSDCMMVTPPPLACVNGRCEAAD